MKPAKLKFIPAIALMAFAVLAAPMGLAAQASPADPAASQAEPAFVRDNLPTFASLTLSNGIPVY
ncbi:MAG: hypothetical protein WA234_10200, partial [Rectinemataceae bacterium]